MADRQRLQLIAELETQGFKRGSKEMQKELSRVERKTLKSTRRQGQAWTQVAYGLDDVQYGFRGVQNNIQALAVSSGASGPLVLAITAATVIVGYFVKKWEDANRAAKEFQKELAKGQGTIATTRLYAEVLRNATEGTDEHTGALNELKKKGYDPAKHSLEDFLRLQERQLVLNALEKASSDEIATLLADRIKIQDKLARLKKDGAPKFSALGTGVGQVAQTPAQLQAAHQAAIARTEGDLSNLDAKIQGVIKKGADAVTQILGEDGIVGFIARGKGTGKGKSVKRDKIKPLDIKASGTTLEQTATWQKTAKKAVSAFADAWNINLKENDKIQVPDISGDLGKLKTAPAVKAGNELGQAVQSGFQNALVGLGETIGAALQGSESLGDGLLKILGGFMSAFGAAIIAVGVGLLNLETGLATVNPFLVIAGGVALVAAGAVVSGLASGGIKGGSGGSSGSSGGGSPGTSVTPTASRQSNSNTRLVASVKGQDLRFVLQGANDSYNARG